MQPKLKAVHLLQEELERAVGLVDAVHKDNQDLLQSLAQLKAWYADLADAHNALQDQHAQLQEERTEVERRCHTLCNGWRGEVEETQAAFDDAQSKIMSQQCVLAALRSYSAQNNHDLEHDRKRL